MKPHKYGAKPVVVDGERFDSTGEYRRWCELKLTGEVCGDYSPETAEAIHTESCPVQSVSA